MDLATIRTDNVPAESVSPRTRLRFDGRMLILGCGSIAQAFLPIISRHLTIEPSRITVLTGDDSGKGVAQKFAAAFHVNPLTRANYESVLDELVHSGDIIVNLSVNVQSTAIAEYAHHANVLYVDTAQLIWPDGHWGIDTPPIQRSNYFYREQMRKLQAALGEGPTAIIGHGANPGMVQHFVKQALLNIAQDEGIELHSENMSKPDWAELACRLQVRAIHVAEHDTQRTTASRKPGEFLHTWSPESAFYESLQPSEIGWGTHETSLPKAAITFGPEVPSILIAHPGAQTLLRSWTPIGGAYNGYAISHEEVVCIAEYLTISDGVKAVYRPTVAFVYQPCDYALAAMHEYVSRGFELQSKRKIMLEEINDGIDELGVLVMREGRRAYWYGSQLSVLDARKIAPLNNATTMQVVSGVVSAVLWAISNPRLGIQEADDINYKFAIDTARCYLEPLVGVYTDWSPLIGREKLFNEVLVKDDPWQFSNFIV